MATIATDVKWGSSPNIYFDFSYDKKREGSTQYYRITVSCDPVTGDSYFGYPIYVQIYLDGTSKATQTLKAASPNRWTSAISYTTEWLSVSKTSGTTALAIRIYSGSGSTRDSKYSYTLAVDPYASKISCTTANIGSKPTITIAKSATNFKHTITYTFGNLSGTIADKTSAASIKDWTIPEDFYAQIPNAKTGEGTLTCVTYDGSTTVGTTTCKLSVTTDESKCKPTVSGSVVDTNNSTIALTGNKNVLVKYHSTATCTMTAGLNKNAGSISAKTINNESVSGTTKTIPNVEVGTFDFWAKDSRGYANSDKVVATLIPYIPLTLTVTARRDDPTSGNASIQIEGDYFKGNFGATNNTLTVKYRLGSDDYTTVTPTISDDTYSATINLSGLDYTRSFTYEVIVSDKLCTISKVGAIQKGIPVFDWGEEDFKFNVPVSIQGITVTNLVESYGTSSMGNGGTWYWTKWSDGRAECYGMRDFGSVALTTEAGNGFYRSSFLSQSFPSGLFKAKPDYISIVCMTSYGMIARLGGNSSTKSSSGDFAILSIGSLTLDTNLVGFHAIGRWK